MAGKTIIITSNEDLINQFCSNKNPNIHIIDLDDDKQVVAMTKDNNNITNLAFLAELSQTNSKTDHIYKRALDSPHNDSSKPVKNSKKSFDMICAICGDRAIGFNFDVLSCGPCKAFFRRNAHQNIENLKCLTGQRQCSIEYEISRKCTRCRLERCFMKGMRKDFIMSEEEKQLKRERLKELRNISSTSRNISLDSNNLSETLNEIDDLMMNINKDDNNNLNSIDNISLKTLSIEDWLEIETIRISFLTTFENNNQNYSCVDLTDPASALISWSHFFNEIALRFISFCRQIDEFENLDGDDRFILIKYHLLSLYPICRCFNLHSINDYSSYNENEMLERHSQLLRLCGASTTIHQSFINLVIKLLQLTEHDSTILILLLIILLFTQGLSMNEDEPSLKNSSIINRTQLHYTTLLWNYLINKRDEIQASKYFIQLINIIFQLQSETKTFREFFRIHMMSPTTVDRIAPLMHTILHIS